jgi:hypothetical protein
MELDGGELLASHPGRALAPGKNIRTGGWVDPRAGLNTEAIGEILFPLPGSKPDRPVVQSAVSHYTD